MSWRRSRAIAGHELRLAASEPGVFVTLLAMPVLMIAFLKPAFAPALEHLLGHPVNGADQAVPGMVTMFSFFTAGFVGFAIFREHGWHTWDRLRASQARSLEIIVGKVTPAVLISLLLQTVLFSVVVAVFGLTVPGSLAGIAVI
ncbi:MAG: ABC transporter permease, partial [Mycobacteriales bacterium]